MVKSLLELDFVVDSAELLSKHQSLGHDFHAKGLLSALVTNLPNLSE